MEAKKQTYQHNNDMSDNQRTGRELKNYKTPHVGTVINTIRC